MAKRAGAANTSKAKSVSAKAATKRTSAAAKATTPAVKPSAAKVGPLKAAKPAAAKGPGKRTSTRKADASDRYTDPALRDRIKAKIVTEGKGGRPGQWSARKAQMVAHEYEAEGGKYKGARDETQTSLTAWGDEHWQTSDGKPALRKDGMHRYLPEKAWAALSPEEKRSTERKKLAGDHAGKQFVANTGAAVKARRKAEKQV